MQLKNLLYFGHIIVYFFYEYDYAKAKPMTGSNIRPATENEFPFIVSIKKILYLNNQEIIKPWCTGTLISKRDVLTTAHCLDIQKNYPILVVVGSTNMMTGDRIYASWWMTYNEWILRNKIRPRYSNNDIGLIKLTQYVFPNIEPAVLSTIRNLSGIEVQIAGWGMLNNGEFPAILQTANLKILTYNECNEKISQYPEANHILDERKVCTNANPNIVVTEGDSGGPLIYGNVVIAINKGCYPTSAPHSEKVNFHLLVSYYKNFIDDFVENIN